MPKPMFAFAVGLGLGLLALVAAPEAAAERAAPIASRTSTVDGLTLHYLAAGRGPAIVLLHGYAETSRMWRPLIPRLAATFTVVAPDLPGIGGSGIPTAASTWRGRRAHARPGEGLGIDKAIVVGHDIGLMVAYAYAAQFPAEVEKLVSWTRSCPVWRAGNRSTTTPPSGISVSTARQPKCSSRGRERTYFEHYWNDFAADKTRSIPEAARHGLHRRVCAARADAGGMGVFRVVPQAAKDFARSPRRSCRCRSCRLAARRPTARRSAGRWRSSPRTRRPWC